MKRWILAIGVAVLTVSTQGAPNSTWAIDPAHSNARFVVRHMAISNVRGDFSKISGTVEYDEKDVLKSSVNATIDVSSIDTRVADRDKDLRSAEFFDAAKYPTITFQSNKVWKEGDHVKLSGDLTIHGVTKELTLDVIGPSATIKDPWGNNRCGLSASTKIDRQDFGLVFNGRLPGGDAVIGDDVAIVLDIEITQRPTQTSTADSRITHNSNTNTRPGPEASANPPLQAADNGPTLPETLQFIQGKLNSLGKVSFVAVTQDSIQGAKGSTVVTETASAIKTDASTCMMRFHWTTTRHGQSVLDQDIELPLKAISNIEVMPLPAALSKANAAEGHPELTVRSTTRSFGHCSLLEMTFPRDLVILISMIKTPQTGSPRPYSTRRNCVARAKARSHSNRTRESTACIWHAGPPQTCRSRGISSAYASKEDLLRAGARHLTSIVQLNVMAQI